MSNELGAQNERQAAGRHQRQPGAEWEAAPPAFPEQQEYVGERGQQVKGGVLVVAVRVREVHSQGWLSEKAGLKLLGSQSASQYHFYDCQTSVYWFLL